MVDTDELDPDDSEPPFYRWDPRVLGVYALHLVCGITDAFNDVAHGLKRDFVAANNFRTGQREFAASVTRDIETITSGGGNG